MKKWEIKETETLLKTPIGCFNTTRKIDPAGIERKYISMKAPDWVCAIVRTQEKEKEFIMVKQFRHGINKEVVEFPSGMVDEGESAIHALKRELDEELGIKEENILNVRELYKASPNPAFMENSMTCYLVNVNGHGESRPDEDEFLETVYATHEEVEKIVVSDDYNVMMRLAWEHAKLTKMID